MGSARRRSTNMVGKMIDESGLIASILSDYEKSVMADAADLIERVTARCESPIERVMVAALIAASDIYYPGLEWHDVAFDEERLACCARGVWVQAPIVGDYRADVCMVFLVKKKFLIFVIECDGHDFHERTKEQAARDRKRDRDMLAKGAIVIRFTGSEIWASPTECAERALDIVSLEIERRAQ